MKITPAKIIAVVLLSSIIMGSFVIFNSEDSMNTAMQLYSSNTTDTSSRTKMETVVTMVDKTKLSNLSGAPGDTSNIPGVADEDDEYDYNNSLIKDYDDTSLSQGPMESAPDNDWHVTFSGRWFAMNFNGKNVMATVNDGAMFYFNTKGSSSVRVCFEPVHGLEEPYYVYYVDGANPQRKHISDGNIQLPDSGEHTIQVVVDGMTERESKWPEGKGVAFEKVEGNGATITPAKMDRKIVMFIGDSITEGIAVLSRDYDANGNSATHSYTWYTAQNLGVEPYFVGFGATGVTEQGSFNTPQVAMNYFYDGRPISNAEQPDCSLVVINIGTNDSEFNPVADNYNVLLGQLHQRYPNIPILCMVPFNQGHRDLIRSLASRYSWCYVVETEGWNISDNGDGVHPNVEGSKVAGTNLANFIRDNKFLE